MFRYLQNDCSALFRGLVLSVLHFLEGPILVLSSPIKVNSLGLELKHFTGNIQTASFSCSTQGTLQRCFGWSLNCARFLTL